MKGLVWISSLPYTFAMLPEDLGSLSKWIALLLPLGVVRQIVSAFNNFNQSSEADLKQHVSSMRPDT